MLNENYFLANMKNWREIAMAVGEAREDRIGSASLKWAPSAQ